MVLYYAALIMLVWLSWQSSSLVMSRSPVRIRPQAPRKTGSPIGRPCFFVISFSFCTWDSHCPLYVPQLLLPIRIHRKHTATTLSFHSSVKTVRAAYRFYQNTILPLSQDIMFSNHFRHFAALGHYRQDNLHPFDFCLKDLPPTHSHIFYTATMRF